MPYPTETVTYPGSGLVFVNSYTTAASFSAYHQAIIAAENQLQKDFTDPVTVNARFDYAPLGTGLAGSNSFALMDVSYSALENALRAHAVTADDRTSVNGLPLTDPSHGIGFEIPTAQARMLGLSSYAPTADDTVTVNSSVGWNFGSDVQGVLEHELSEGVFGRIGSLGLDGGRWAPMDLFRFTAGGARDYTGGSDGQTTYFGIDSAHVQAGAYVAAYHNAISVSGVNDGGDLADWNSTRGDAFGPTGPSAPGALTHEDLQILDVLGWTPPSSAATGVSLTASEAAPSVIGGSGGDTLAGYAGPDTISGGDGNDSILGGAGFDAVNGNKGDDSIDGGSGGNDWLLGGQGNDVISAHSGHNLLYGNLGDDTLHGGSGGDIVRGGQGDDSIVAGSGAQWISGDRGDDTIQGGVGPDTFHSFSGAGQDVVFGFDGSKGDHVQLDVGTHYTLSQSGADTVIDMGGGDEMILKNVTLADLPAGWLFER